MIRPRRGPILDTSSLLAFPVVRPDARPHLLGALTLVHQSAALSPRAREPAERATAVLGLRDPVDLRVAPNRGVLRVHEDHLVVLVAAVLADPVRVQDLHVRVALRDPLLRHPLDRLPHRDLVHPAALRVAPAHRPGLPPAAASDARPHDDVPGLRAISQLPRAVDAGGMLDANERRPAPPRDLAGPRELLHVALRGDLPRLPHVAVQVPRLPRGLLPLLARDRHGLRRLLVRHGDYPWIFGFARRYISRPGSPPLRAVGGSKRAGL